MELRRRAKWLWAVGLSAVGLLAVAPAALATPGPDYTWNGTGGTNTWSTAGNWTSVASPGTAPSGTVGPITFPTTNAPSSVNDVSGITADDLAISGDTSNYRIAGNSITLDPSAGTGLSVSGVTSGSGNALLKLPIVLGTNQTWDIGGTGGFDSLTLQADANVTGAPSLAIKFPSGSTGSTGNGTLYAEASTGIETGAVTVGGYGTVDIHTALNGGTSNPVTIGQHSALTAGALGASVGPLDVSHAQNLTIGSAPGGDGTLAVSGDATVTPATTTFYIDQAGTQAGADYSQLTASGAVSLGGKLSLSGTNTCTALHAGDVDTLIHAQGGVSGTFSNAPAGTALSITCGSTTRQATINYTANTVTATIVGTQTTTNVAASNTSPTAGGSVTYTATVAPSGPTGSVSFMDGGTPISGCTAQPLSSSTATCTVKYASAGSHSITASYGGDDTFLGSTSPQAVAVTVKAAPSSGGGTPPASGGATPPPPPPSGGTPPPPGQKITPAPAGVTATTLAAGGLKTTRATLNGTLATGGQAVTWRFQYGRGRRYDKATPSRTIAAGGTGQVHVSATLKRLSAYTKFHFRLVVLAGGAGNAGQAAGRDRTFTTKSTGKVVTAAGTLSIVGGTILVPETCQSKLSCRGRLSITTATRVGTRHKLATVMLASATFRIRAHRRAVVRVRVAVASVSRVRQAPNHRQVVKLTTRSQTGQVGQVRKITLALG